MDDEELSVLDRDKSVAAERTAKDHVLFDRIGIGKESVATDLAEELTFVAVVLVEEDHGSATARTADVLRNITSLTTLDRRKFFAVLPAVVLEEILPLPVLWSGTDVAKDGRLIHSVLLVFGRMRIIESPLLERDISADKRDQPAVLLVEIVTQLNEILYNVHEQYIPFFGECGFGRRHYTKKRGYCSFYMRKGDKPQ